MTMASIFSYRLCLSLMFTLCLIGTTFEESIFDTFIAPFACATRIVSAISTCQHRLAERLEIINKAEQEISENVDKSVFACCYLAEFSHCMDIKTEGKCGSEISEGIARGANAFVRSLYQKCEEYQYYSPTCLFVNYLNFVMVFGIILFLIGIILCFIDCFRRF